MNERSIHSYTRMLLRQPQHTQLIQYCGIIDCQRRRTKTTADTLRIESITLNSISL